MRRNVYDAPITAIACPASTGDVYFASGNYVYRSERVSSSCSLTSGSQSFLNTARFATAPQGTSIISLEVAYSSTHAPLVFMGAADHLLVQCGAEGDLSSSLCTTVLRADGERVLRVVADARRGVVLVLTASNNLFYCALDLIVRTLSTPPTSDPHDISSCCPFARIRGPLLGVVLAADCFVLNPFLPDSCEGTSVRDVERTAYASCHLFAATYTGEVVEWKAFWHEEGAGEGSITALSTCKQNEAACVVSRVQAHPSGCAIFAVRVTGVFSALSNVSNTWDKTALLARMHLVSCSDDRSVALYGRRYPITRIGDSPEQHVNPQENGWVLLWRGGGPDFARSRIFDVAVHAAWRQRVVENCERSWRSCTVHVGVAGEDGSVHAIEVNHSECGDLVGPSVDGVHDSDTFEGVATPRLVRPHQHRGHGAYRVAFSTATRQSLTLVSGGFDGAVFAHSLDSASEDGTDHRMGSAQLRMRELMLRPPIEATVKLDEGAVAEGRADVLQPCPALTVSARKMDQVRAVHVDSNGLLLACTGGALCVKCSHSSASSWWIALPVEASQQRSGGARGDSPLDCGLPATLESVVAASCESSMKGSSLASVGCALIGTTTGVLCVVPYSFSSARLDEFLPVVSVAAQKTHRPDERRFLVTSALHSFGKITQISALSAPHFNLSVIAESSNSHTGAEAHSSVGATATEFIVATNHLRGAVVLSRLRLMFSHASASSGRSSAGSGSAVLSTSAVWYTLAVYSDGPGSLTTALSLVHIVGGQQSVGESNGDDCGGAKRDAALAVWLFVGDKDGCLLGTRHDVSNSSIEFTSVAVQGDPLPSTTSLRAAARIHRYVFAERLHIAITAICIEFCCFTKAADNVCMPSTLLITAAGTGGVVGYVYLDLSSSCSDKAAEAFPMSSCAVEPLRLPFEVSSVLSISPSLWVVQCGTTVSFLYRVPGKTSWVSVGSCDGVRAPRLLTARVVSDSPSGGLSAFFAHCSDGQTVEQAVVQTGRVGSTQNTLPLRGVHTALLYGKGFPGKDYNCVAYAPAPLDCLLMGNEDCSLVIFPIQAADAATELPHTHSLSDGLLAPLNVCGTHHSNILALAVLPRTEVNALRFVSVGGGAMVNLWSAAELSSPLELLDWWCGGRTPSRLSAAGPGKNGVSASNLHTDMAPEKRCISSARFHRRRAKQAAGGSASLTLTDRMPRFMAVTVVSPTEFAVGSSDGTVLFFSVHRVEGVEGRACQSTGGATLQLRWQGVLNTEQTRPIMCMSCANDLDHGALTCILNYDRISPLVVAGDTNGIVYVVDSVSHTVRSQAQLEKSCVNAISELQRMPDVLAVQANSSRHHWRFATLHDSGVVHLMALVVDEARGDDTVTAQLRLLWSASTGLTAGRSVHWPALSQPLVVVTEEHLVEFDPEAAQRGELCRLNSQRVGVRCVSGAAVLGGPPGDEQIPARSRVAIVGQGFEVVG